MEGKWDKLEVRGGVTEKICKKRRKCRIPTFSKSIIKCKSQTRERLCYNTVRWCSHTDLCKEYRERGHQAWGIWGTLTEFEVSELERGEEVPCRERRMDQDLEGKKEHREKTQGNSRATLKVFLLSNYYKFSGFCFCCPVTKSCRTLCNPLDCSTPGGFPIHHNLQFTQIHVYQVSDAI